MDDPLSESICMRASLAKKRVAKKFLPSSQTGIEQQQMKSRGKDKIGAKLSA